MKLAFVDNLPVGGGLSRFSYKLCESLIDLSESLHIDYYLHELNLKRTPELSTLSSRLTIKILETTIHKPAVYSPVPPVYRRAVNKLIRYFKSPAALPQVNTDTIKEIEERIVDYDVAFFPVAHMMKKPNLKVPMVGTIHDFNWKYFFGSQIFSSEFVRQMDVSILDWLTTTVTACSAHDVVTEAKKLYPHLKTFPDVVHIGPVVFSNDIEESRATKLLSEMNIDYPYLLFPGNFFPHKNHLNLFSAFSILTQKEEYKSLKLILTGVNTDQISYGVAEKVGVRLVDGNRESYNVRGLGYQPNEVIDALIKKATLMVSPSIYEAICTPGMDAWNFGTPTAISDIPPFREHEQVWGIRSAFFDPMNPEDIARTINDYLTDYETAKSDGAISKENMAKYGWNKVAQGYMKLFQKAIKSYT